MFPLDEKRLDRLDAERSDAPRLSFVIRSSPRLSVWNLRLISAGQNCINVPMVAVFDTVLAAHTARDAVRIHASANRNGSAMAIPYVPVDQPGKRAIS